MSPRKPSIIRARSASEIIENIRSLDAAIVKFKAQHPVEETHFSPAGIGGRECNQCHLTFAWSDPAAPRFCPWCGRRRAML